MAFGKTLVLASPLAGRLVDGAGQPLSGVTVARSSCFVVSGSREISLVSWPASFLR